MMAEILVLMLSFKAIRRMDGSNFRKQNYHENDDA
jgi:hypothetical protein